jgi:hypothetical protein
MLLRYVNGGMLWIYPLVSIKIQLIARIMGLSIIGEESTTLFTNKVGERELFERMKEKFNTYRGK